MVPKENVYEESSLEEGFSNTHDFFQTCSLWKSLISFLVNVDLTSTSSHDISRTIRNLGKINIIIFA